MTTTVTRKQAEMLAVAKGLARGLDAQAIVTETGLNPGCVYHFLRRLRHLRVTGDEVTAILDAAGEHADAYLLALFVARRNEQKARSKAARKAKGGAV